MATNDHIFMIMIQLFSVLEPTPCVDTPGWDNGQGKTCSIYEGERLCANGEVTESFESWHDYNDPTENCCSCGKESGKRFANQSGWLKAIRLFIHRVRKYFS